MSTYFAHYQVIDSGHPLNRGLEAYYLGNLPRVPWAIGYDPKIIDTICTLQWQTAREPYTLYQEMTPPLQAKEEG
jgi:hypothetical protein